MPGLLDGKVAIVTGAAHGIGRGHALELAKQGAAVVVNDLGTTISGDGSGRDADVVVDIIRSRGGRAIADYGDVGDEDQVEALVERAWTEYGRVDILVNNAGIVRDRAIWNMPVTDFDLVMRVHVRGTWLACRSVARRWRTNAKASTGTTYGRIINTVSGAGLLGHFGQSNYATAKSAIAGLTLTLSLELASIGVTVNAIGPGGLTRLSASGKDDVVPEPDERPEDSFDPLDASFAPLSSRGSRASRPAKSPDRSSEQSATRSISWADGPRTRSPAATSSAGMPPDSVRYSAPRSSGHERVDSG